MKHSLLVSTLFASTFALASLAAPSEAHAQFRATVHLGVEHLASQGNGTTMLQMRGEAMVSTKPWLDVGLYGQRLEAFDARSEGGWGVGGLVTLRPMTMTSFAPLAFGSLGYQRAPSGAVFNDGMFFEVGGGVAWRAASVLDLELRGGFVGLVGGNRDLTGFTVGLGISLHP